tara:strand:- start:143 stop:739 length:597 start_codon:yes stop_codon:yes gene_type:complete
MATYKKDHRVVKDPKSPGRDLRDVDWEERKEGAMTPEDYKAHMYKKYKLMTRNMNTLKKVRKKDMHPDEAEYLARKEFEYKKRHQPEGVYDFVYEAKAESKRDAAMYKTLKSAIDQKQDLSPEIVEKKRLFKKSIMVEGDPKPIQGKSVLDLVKLSSKQREARQEFVMDYGDYDKAAKGIKPKKQTRNYKNNTYKEGE